MPEVSPKPQDASEPDGSETTANKSAEKREGGRESAGGKGRGREGEREWAGEEGRGRGEGERCGEVTEVPELVPLQVIERNRLSLGEILALPRFGTYSPGEPSKVGVAGGRGWQA